MPGKDKAQERHYWDACVFLSIVNGVPNRVPILKNLLSEARLGKIQIVTSTISIAEVAFAISEKTDGKLSSEDEERIKSLWDPHQSPIVLIELHQLIGHRARDLMRAAISTGRHLKPPDAIHLASAISVDATEFNTYDKGLSKYSGVTQIPVQEPFSNSLPL